MSFDYAKTTTKAGVNSEYGFGHPSFKMDRDFLPERLEGDALFHQCLDVCQFVNLARDEVPLDSDKAKRTLQDFIAFDGEFLTNAMRAFGIKTARDGAFFVRMDKPKDAFNVMDDYLAANKKAGGLGLKPKHKFQKHSDKNFVDGEQLVWDEIAARAVRFALKQAFAFKWERNLLRPEEMAHRVLKGELEAPEWFEKELRQEVYVNAVESDMRSFTVYEEGSPDHTSDPAGHGAVFGASYVLAVLKYGLLGNSKVHNEVAQSYLSLAHLRSAAGVHYKTDNLNGFRIGAVAMIENIGDLLRNAGVGLPDVTALEAYAKEISLDWVK